MSDPMTNMGADDVLASIRRLVSETYDPKLRQKTPERVPDRLVLSPDLRVVEGRSDASVFVEQSDPQAKPAPTAAPFMLKTQVAKDAPVGDTVQKPVKTQSDGAGTADALFETMNAKIAASSEQENDRDATKAAPFTIDAKLDVQSQKWPSEFDDIPNAQAADHAAKLSLEQRIAELESAVESQVQDWDSDGSDDFDDAAAHGVSQAFAQSGARVLNFRSAELAPHIQPAPAGSIGHTATPTTVFEDAVKAETHVSDDLHRTLDRTVQADHNTNIPVPETQDDALQGPVDDDLPLAGYSSDELLDEDTLRDMVTDVIRQELQGALGERITANVRRLVRREVRRAMTLREFD
ncbi:hypothetical protein [Pacificibacter marinus]|uniref:Uncharacterized protein n=1 Tax=Pacificibacter marinus TaxID=658057 RepID=A0A1Y5SS29_9RHOB|nr:hypothetical protein [Pacificibacter marinus]SEK65904.1 hypothetical protein SAMN04488032_10510 [Pacificibacter marinus]SLN47159.1 hypothetical protein PAM7971_02315 [Pacificibacter marinus]